MSARQVDARRASDGDDRPRALNAINIVSTQVEGTDMLRLAAQGMGIATEEVEKAQLLGAG
jgi:hypothetical protein